MPCKHPSRDQQQKPACHSIQEVASFNINCAKFEQKYLENSKNRKSSARFHIIIEVDVKFVILQKIDCLVLA
jgi:hypothetical protein